MQFKQSTADTHTNNLRKNIIVFIITILLSLIGVFLTYNFIQSKIQIPPKKTSKHTSAPIQTMNVSVPTEFIPRGTQIKAAMLKKRTLPASQVNNDMILFADKHIIIGKTNSIDFTAGIPIGYSALQNSKALVFSDLLKKGERAITIPLDIYNSMHGYIQPGDMINLLVTIKKGKSHQTYPLLQKINVLATDTFYRPGIHKDSLPNSGELSTITLRVNNEQARTIIFAKSQGTISSILRNAQDNTSAATKEYKPQVLIPTPHKIQYIIGSSTL